jgi:hypothetical protein
MDHPRSPLAVVLALIMALAAAMPVSAQQSPLEPLDNSSQRATFECFIEQTDRIEAATLEAYDSRSGASRQQVEDELSKLQVLFDFSGVADNQVVDEVGTAIAFPSTTTHLSEDPGLPRRLTPSSTPVATSGREAP